MSKSNVLKGRNRQYENEYSAMKNLLDKQKISMNNNASRNSLKGSVTIGSILKNKNSQTRASFDVSVILCF